ncbi:hypothetical protein MSS93_06855 [Deinococcus radiodurans]|nr:hypothetical protein MSS93_06855 [Deinococcus radiodurans]
MRDVPLTRELYIERDDFSPAPPKGFKRLTPGGTVRLRGAGIIRADDFGTDEAGQVTHIRATLLGEDAKAAGVIHWVSAERALPAEFRLYDRLFRVPHPEGENADVEDDSAGPAEHEAEPGAGQETAPVSQGFMRYLTPDSLRVLRGYVEPSVAGDPADTRYQFERQGYFWRDPVELERVDSREDALVFGRIITLKDTWASRAAAPSRRRKARSDPLPRGEGLTKSGVRGLLPQLKPMRPKPSPSPPNRTPNSPGCSASVPRRGTPAPSPVTRRCSPSWGGGAGDTFAQVASWTVNELVAGLRAGEVKVRAADLAPLAEGVASGQLSARIAREALARAAASGDAPLTIIEREGLNAGLSAEALQQVVAQVIAANPDKAEAYRGGKTALLGFFTGQVMRATAGKADPQALAAALKDALA